MNILRFGIIGAVLLSATAVIAYEDGPTNMGPDGGFVAFSKHDQAGELADRLKSNPNVVGVMSGHEDAVAIIFTKEPTPEEVSDVCTKAENVGFSVMHKIIRLKATHPLEDMCP